MVNFRTPASISRERRVDSPIAVAWGLAGAAARFSMLF
jgi:hypothetical protein